MTPAKKRSKKYPSLNLTPAKERRYVKSKGDHCPFCGASGDFIQELGCLHLNPPGSHSQAVLCHHCKHRWHDIFKLSAVVSG